MKELLLRRKPNQLLKKCNTEAHAVLRKWLAGVSKAEISVI